MNILKTENHIVLDVEVFENKKMNFPKCLRDCWLKSLIDAFTWFKNKLINQQTVWCLYYSGLW